MIFAQQQKLHDVTLEFIKRTCFKPDYVFVSADVINLLNLKPTYFNGILLKQCLGEDIVLPIKNARCFEKIMDEHERMKKADRLGFRILGHIANPYNSQQINKP